VTGPFQGQEPEGDMTLQWAGSCSDRTGLHRIRTISEQESAMTEASNGRVPVLTGPCNQQEPLVTGPCNGQEPEVTGLNNRQDPATDKNQ
jgi:hypothetical protein